MSLELIFKGRQPRRIMSMVMEVALEYNKHDNERCADIREAYPVMDEISRTAPRDDVAFSNEMREALVVGDFPYYFGRTISAAVYDQYKARMGAWRDYTYRDTVPDYRDGYRYQFSSFNQPVLRREKEEVRPGYIYELTRRTLAVEDYAKQIDFSKRILQNDDLGAFNNITREMSTAAQRFLDTYVSALYDNALSQAALVALGANYSGTGRLTTANLAIAYNAFVQRVDARGEPIDVMPRYIVGPPILELTARQILESERIAELATNAINPFRGGQLQFRADPRIAFTAPNVPWYLFADPADVPGVSVVWLQTMQQEVNMYAKAPDKVPMSVTGALGTAQWQYGSFLTGDIEMMVELTVGSRTDDLAGLVGITDAQGVYYSSGTTP